MAQACLIQLLCNICIGLGCIFATTNQGNVCVANRSQITGEPTLVIDDKEGLIFCPSTFPPPTSIALLQDSDEKLLDRFSVVKNYAEVIIWIILLVIALTGGSLGKRALKKLKKKLDSNHAHLSSLLQSLIDSSTSTITTSSIDVQTDWNGEWESQTPLLQTHSSNQSNTNPFFSFSTTTPSTSTAIDHNPPSSSSGQTILPSTATSKSNLTAQNGNVTPPINNLITLNDTLEMLENSITRPSHSNVSFNLPEIHSFSAFRPQFCSSKNEPPPVPPREHPVRDRKQTEFYQAQ